MKSSEFPLELKDFLSRPISRRELIKFLSRAGAGLCIAFILKGLPSLAETPSYQIPNNPEFQGLIGRLETQQTLVREFQPGQSTDELAKKILEDIETVISQLNLTEARNQIRELTEINDGMRVKVAEFSEIEPDVFPQDVKNPSTSVVSGIDGWASAGRISFEKDDVKQALLFSLSDQAQMADTGEKITRINLRNIPEVATYLENSQWYEVSQAVYYSDSGVFQISIRSDGKEENLHLCYRMQDIAKAIETGNFANLKPSFVQQASYFYITGNTVLDVKIQPDKTNKTHLHRINPQGVESIATPAVFPGTEALTDMFYELPGIGYVRGIQDKNGETKLYFSEKIDHPNWTQIAGHSPVGVIRSFTDNGLIISDKDQKTNQDIIYQINYNQQTKTWKKEILLTSNPEIYYKTADEIDENRYLVLAEIDQGSNTEIYIWDKKTGSKTVIPTPLGNHTAFYNRKTGKIEIKIMPHIANVEFWSVDLAKPGNPERIFKNSWIDEGTPDRYAEQIVVSSELVPSLNNNPNPDVRILIASNRDTSNEAVTNIELAVYGSNNTNPFDSLTANLSDISTIVQNPDFVRVIADIPGSRDISTPDQRSQAMRDTLLHLINKYPNAKFTLYGGSAGGYNVLNFYINELEKAINGDQSSQKIIEKLQLIHAEAPVISMKQEGILPEAWKQIMEYHQSRDDDLLLKMQRLAKLIDTKKPSLLLPMLIVNFYSNDDRANPHRIIEFYKLYLQISQQIMTIPTIGGHDQANPTTAMLNRLFQYSITRTTLKPAKNVQTNRGE